MRTILFVEDQPFFRHLLSLGLKDLSGYTLLLAENGHEALSFLQRGSRLPDLIVTDISMPIMDGLELMRRLRQDGRLSTIPIIVCSADEQLEAEALDLGALSFVDKASFCRGLVPLIIDVLCVRSGFPYSPKRHDPFQPLL